MPEKINNGLDDQINKHHTLYDDVFKTQCSYMLPLLIPVVNELFGTDYELDKSELERYANEHMKMAVSEDDSQKVSKVISDSYLKLNGVIYHIECQSTADGSILIRILDYNMQIAYENAKLNTTKEILEVKLPNSAIMMLRPTSEDEPKKTERIIRYYYKDQQIDMVVPVMHVQGYSMKEIYEKNLYFLIPFFPLRYEKSIEHIANNCLENLEEYDKIYSELKEFTALFYDAYIHDKLSENYTRELATLYRKVVNLISDKLEDDYKERLVNTMDGQVLELQCQKWFREGREEALQEAQDEINRERTRAENAETLLNKANAELDSANAELVSANAYIKELEEKLALNN